MYKINTIFFNHFFNSFSKFSASSMESILQSPKSLLTRRISRSKSIPPALVINPNPTGTTVTSSSSSSQIHNNNNNNTSRSKDGHHSTVNTHTNSSSGAHKKNPTSKLRQLAEIITTSPRSPYSQSPMPSLTPSLLNSDGTADWGLKSPSAKFSFHDKSVSLNHPILCPLLICANKKHSLVKTIGR